jgi:hypothetical protein
MRDFDILFTALFIKIDLRRPERMAHTCNPSYLGGRGQEDGDSRPAQAKKS